VAQRLLRHGFRGHFDVRDLPDLGHFGGESYIRQGTRLIVIELQIQAWNYAEGPPNTTEQEELMTKKNGDEVVANGKTDDNVA
jgi:hypothetical protein